MHRPSLTSFFAWKPTAFHICIRKYMVCQGFSRNERFVQRQSVRPHKLNNPNLFQQPKQVSKLHRQPSSIVGSSGPMDRAHRSHRWGTGSGPVATTTLRRRLWISHSGAKTWACCRKQCLRHAPLFCAHFWLISVLLRDRAAPFL